MSRTVTALFDSRSDAEAAKQRLQQSRIDADNIAIHDKSSSGFNENSYSSSSDPGMWASIKNAFLPDEDRHTYEEGVRRGGVLLTADVDETCVDDAVRILEESSTVDIEDRSQQWRSSGWDYMPGRGHMSTPDAARSDLPNDGTPAPIAGMGTNTSTNTNTTNTGTNIGTSQGNEQIIPVVEEELIVGKREVERGSVRVRSYVTEKPVHEQVRLREERVNVERRPVERNLESVGAEAFQERTIDMTATSEEAVIGKNARVVEEVVVSKTAGERVEEVSDTVRRTDVEIDRDSDSTTRTQTDRDRY
jgi:uncharacterized protein (TIGR02271 family)